MVSGARRESIDVSGAVTSTVNVTLAASASTLPAASLASTRKVCSPSVSSALVNGDAQTESGAWSKAQRKLASSVAENAKVGVASFPGSAGPESTAVSGATVSIVHVCEAAVPSTLPAASVAVTANVCSPSASAS